MRDPLLVLRDVHPAPATPWWPPAPGWWLLGGLLCGVAMAFVLLRRRRTRRRVQRERLFDSAWAQADGTAARLAAASELLRRAARLQREDADRLEGEAWLEFLDDGDTSRPFSTGAGRVLLQGGFMREVDAAQADAARVLARRRFLQWMGK